jgi:hypothetical protein
MFSALASAYLQKISCCWSTGYVDCIRSASECTNIRHVECTSGSLPYSFVQSFVERKSSSLLYSCVQTFVDRESTESISIRDLSQETVLNN